MDISMIILGIIAFILIGFLIFIILIYNGLVRLKNSIDKNWANIDVLLRQRSDEIPNVVNTVRGYMVHERQTLETLTKARSFIMKAEITGHKAAADAIISDTLKTLFAVAENYPDLKANENFLKLQHRITTLENELADRRELYNDTVTIYNTRIQSIPDIVVAKMIHSTRVEWFKASEDDRQRVEVNL